MGMTADLRTEVRRTLRLDIAAARERAELVEAIEGSVLWARLTEPKSRPQVPDSAMTGDALESSQKPASGPCTECGYPTERWDAENGDFCCEDCCERIVRGQEEDKRLDDPRRR